MRRTAPELMLTAATLIPPKLTAATLIIFRVAVLLAAAALMIAALISVSLVAAPAAAADSPPVNLGAEGLTPGLRVLKASDVSPWADVDPGSAVVVEIGAGDYYVAGLPDAVGRERYFVVMTSAGDPNRALATYVYGAKPGQRIVWRSDIVLPARPRTFKQGDSFGAVELRVNSGLPVDISDGATVATFQLYDPSDDVVLFSGRAAVISDVTQDATSGSWGASLIYDLQAGDLDVAGTLLGEFRICYPSGACHTLPTTPALELVVLEAF